MLPLFKLYAPPQKKPTLLLIEINVIKLNQNTTIQYPL